MFKQFTIAVLCCVCSCAAMAEITLEQCVDLSRENYPLIRKYNLLDKSTLIELSDINKAWLPQIGVYGQATAQNAVPALPNELSGMLDMLGSDIRGLGKVQYKAGVDISQTIWDGGQSKSRRNVVRAVDREQSAAIDVQLYALRERVESLFFGILLIDEQIRQTEQTHLLLSANLDMLRSMLANGTAMQADADMVEAQLLTIGQQIIQAKSRAQDYRRLLGIYTGRNLMDETFVKPAPSMPGNFDSDRPELKLFGARMAANKARLGDIKASLMPSVGFFAQAYYGYPGFDYFKSMRNRDLSFNILAGVKISWGIGSFYTKKNRERQLQLADDGVNVDRETFLFDTGLQTESQNARIRELQDVMKEDTRIVELRAAVRRAAESQLKNGVIDATALLTKITDENQARITSSYHEIQYLQSIYQLKYTLNR